MFRVTIKPGLGLAAPLGRLFRGFRNESGAVAIWFAIMALPMAVLGFGLIDINRASVEKRHLQDALDAATLLAARSNATTNAQMQTVGGGALAAQMTGVSEATLQSSSFKIVGTKVTGTATASVVPVIAGLWLQGNMIVGADAEVMRSSTNLEVSIVLDITGSMAGTRLTDLKTAASDLIDLVVSDTQTPYYSKAAIVPYSIGVNVGGYAASARGAVTGAKAITGASWTTGSSKNITGATRASPVVITSSSHGFANGDVVWISGVSGMTQLNNRAFVVANKTTNTFQLSGVNGTAYSSFSSGGVIRKCLVADCGVVITAAGHGLNNGDTAYITGVGGMTQLNGQTFTVANKATNSYSLAGVNGASYGTYTSGGSSWCTAAGCQYYQFVSPSSTTNLFQVSTCVTERTGAQAYTDVAPSSAPVGRNYDSTANPCPTSTLTPLSSNKTTLKSQVTGLVATGSTAGQIGIAWGWYMVSPNFAYLWPSASQPAAYATPDLLKVVVIMTDGDFNTPYCNGVIAKDAGTGSGATSDHINCNATNGDPVAQGLALCTAMKAKGVVVYTVGFDVGTGTTAESLMKGCATSAANVYLPSSGTALKDAFAAIGRDITKLRLSK